MANLDSKLDEILHQLSSQRDEINNLQTELKQNSTAISKEVKKVKEGADYTWKRQGNKYQFLFNSELEESLKQAEWAINHQKLEYAQEVIEEGLNKIKQRNKLIKLADSSEGGWETAKQYQNNPLASDSEDEKKLQKAEYRAIQKKRKIESKHVSKKQFKASRTEPSNSLLSSCIFPAWGQGAYGIGPVGQLQMGQRGQPFRQQPSFTGARGCCFACGSFTHWRKECPFLKPVGDTTGKQ